MGRSTFMVVATIHPDADRAALGALVPEEVAQVERLREQGLMGAVHIAMARRTVFIETFADTEAEALQTVGTLPLARFFDVDVFATNPPGLPPADGQAQP